MKLKICLAAMSLMLAGWVHAETRIGVLNLQRIFTESAPAKKANDKLTKEFAARTGDIEALMKKLQSLQMSMDKAGMTMSENDRRNKERELASLNAEFQRKRREYQEDYSLRNNEEMKSLQDQVLKVVKQVAETNKLDVVLSEVVWANSSVDISDQVIKALADK